MKGGTQGLKVSQVSLILIGLVCVTVLTFAWTKTTLLTSFIPAQSRVLQLDLDEELEPKDFKNKIQSVACTSRHTAKELYLWGEKKKLAIACRYEFCAPCTGFRGDKAGPRETLGGNINSIQIGTRQVDSLCSPGTSKRENIENFTTINKGDVPASVIESTGPEEVYQIKNKSRQAEIVPENSLNIESSVRSEQTGNLSATTGKKEIPPSVIERTGSEEHRGGKNKSKQAELVPEKSVETEQTRNLSAITGKKDCNYAKGKWVFDDSRPLYSGTGCKQWLSSMWACRLTQRTDFEYEKLRWQPKDCKMEEFTGFKFLQRMQDKTLAFVGDSLGRQQFQSLMCLVTGGEERPDVLDVGYEYGLVKARGAVRPDGWAYRFPSTNTTILFYWSASLCNLEPINVSNPATDIAMHLDRPPAFLRRFIHKFDVLVLNTGHHWNRGKLKANRWVMYVGGVPNTNRKIADIGGAKNLTVHSVVRWVNLQIPLYPGLRAFFRSISPRHFFNGDWNTGGTCDNTVLSGGMEVVKDESSDPLAARAVRGTNVKLLDITGLSELRDEGHISRYSIKATPGIQDCLHWCLPGVPDTWNEVLFAQI